VSSDGKNNSAVPTLFFARYAPANLEPKNSIGAKWPRLLAALPLKEIVSSKRTAIKMHLGGGSGFTTVHPLFVRKLVEAVRAAGAKDVFVTDMPYNARSAAERGYTQETIGCAIIPATGTADKYCYKRSLKPPIKTLKQIELAGEIADAEALIDLSHVKGHGDCGFGGASKNLSMGCVTQNTRVQLHSLEGGLAWEGKRCTHCGVCIENCPNQALKFDEENDLQVFYHHCKFCQHCVLICPRKAIRGVGGYYERFQSAMAATSAKVLDNFAPRNVLFINFLMNITIYCDCWGMTSPALVPDIGILAGQDIVAIEQASLDMIKVEDLLPKALLPGTKLGSRGHLFERVHSKDPLATVEALAKLKRGSRKYKLEEIA
jgi:uncharacterized Fe-S center protein